MTSRQRACSDRTAWPKAWGESAIAIASRSLRNLEWFEVVDVRGSIRDNKVANYQVTLKLGLRYEPKA
jgi:flavin-binding protein dodecin